MATSIRHDVKRFLQHEVLGAYLHYDFMDSLSNGTNRRASDKILCFLFLHQTEDAIFAFRNRILWQQHFIYLSQKH